jgi:WD40 repeat protein
VVAVSPPYSPPEQYYASRPLTPATDIYSLAATLYTMLSFSMPPDAIAREAGEQVQSLLQLNGTVTPAFWEGLKKGMDLNPARRPQTMEAFLLELGADDRSPSGAVMAQSFKVEKVAEIDAHRGGIYRLQLHPGRRLLISGSRHGSVGLWKWPECESWGLLKAHESPMSGFALSPDGSLLATAGEPGEVKLWSVDSGQMLRLLRSGLPAVSSLAFSADSQIISAGMADGTTHLFTPQREEPFILQTNLGGVNAVAFSPDGTMMATAGQDRLINIWDTRTGAMVLQFSGHTRPVLHLEFSSDSALLLSGASDYTTRIWDFNARLEMRRLREDGPNIWCASFTSDSDVVVSGNSDKKLRFYRLSSGREVFSTLADKNYLRSLVCDFRHPLVATGGGDGLIRVWRFQP